MGLASNGSLGLCSIGLGMGLGDCVVCGNQGVYGSRLGSSRLRKLWSGYALLQKMLIYRISCLKWHIVCLSLHVAYAAKCFFVL